MPKNIEAIFNKITNYGLYLLAFLIPLFFLPYTHLPVLANKQLFAAVLCGLLLLVWVIKIMITGQLRFKWSRLTIAVGMLVILAGLSTVFSLSRHQSFWGMAFEPDTFFSFILYALIFLLSSNLIENKIQAMRILKAFLLGAGVLALFFFIQTFFGAIFPWDFTKVIGFNPVGTVTLLSLLFGGALIIDTVLISDGLRTVKKQRKLNFIGMVVIGILLLVNIVLINHWSSWVVIGLSSILMVWVKGFKKESIIAVCLMVLAFLFILIDIPTNELVQLPADVALTYRASFSIAKETIFQGFDKFLLGSGPATFTQDYELFRPLGVNSTVFWQASFTQSIAAFFTFLATLGVLGLICLLFLMAVFFLQGFKSVFSVSAPSGEALLSVASDRTYEGNRTQTDFCLFVAGFYFLILWFFCSVNFTLMFLGFLILGLWVPLSKHKLRVVELKLESMRLQQSFFIMLLCIIAIVAVVVGLYRVSKNYVAALVFNEGVGLIRAESADLDKGVEKLRRAGEMAFNDNYFRNLSRALFLKIEQVQDSDISKDEKVAVLQGLVNEIELVVEKAVNVSPKNGQNWINMGNSYTELARMGISRAGELAVATYQKSKEFSPRDPLVYFNLATAYVLLARDANAQADSIDATDEQTLELIQMLRASVQGQLGLAVESLQKSIQLKPDFAEAVQLLSQLTSE